MTTWVTLTASDALAAMPTDIRTLYDQWIIDNPSKADALERLVEDTVAQIRTAIRTNLENTLDPDETKIPQDLRPITNDLITVRLAMEAGIQISSAASQTRNDADQLMRMIAYGRWKVDAPGYEPSPIYSPPTRQRSRLPGLIALALFVAANAQAAFTTTGSGTSINVGNVQVTNNITITNNVDIIGTTITNSFAPTLTITNLSSITNTFTPSITITNIHPITNTFAASVSNSFAPVNNISNSFATSVSNSFAPVNNVTNSFTPVNNVTNTFTVNAGVTITNYFGDTFINPTTQVNVAGVVVTNNIIIQNPGITGFQNSTTGGVFLAVSNGWDAGITTNGNIYTIQTGLPPGATGVNQVATWNGTNWVAQALGAPSPTPFVGTNVVKWTTVWGVTNTWVAPTTQILFTAWGSGGGCGAGGAGHARAIWVGSAGTIFDIVIGTGGGTGTTNNGPFAGKGFGVSGSNTCNGGGATYIAISGTTNIILIAGASGGGYTGLSGAASPGGGFYFGTLDGYRAGGATNVSPGQGAWALNEYGLDAVGGTNIAVSGTQQNGTYLLGGTCNTNGTPNPHPTLGGGGGGWYGGAAATKTNASFGASTGAGGGGGLSYANTNYVTFAQLIAGEAISAGSPPAQDHPTYTAGRGGGGVGNAGNGQSGCAGAMW